MLVFNEMFHFGLNRHPINLDVIKHRIQKTISSFKPRGRTETLKQLHKLDTYDRTNSTSLPGFVRDQIIKELYDGYEEIVKEILRALPPQQYKQLHEITQEDWGDLMQSLTFVIKYRLCDTIEQRFHFTMFSNAVHDALQSPLVSNNRKLFILDMLVLLAPTWEQREQYEELLANLRLNNTNLQARKDKYQIDTDAQNVHSSVLNTLYRRKLIQLSKLHSGQREGDKCTATLLEWLDKAQDLKHPADTREERKTKLSYLSRLYAFVVDKFNTLKTSFISTFTRPKTTRNQQEVEFNFNDPHDREVLEVVLKQIDICPITFAPTELRLKDVFEIVVGRCLQLQDKPYFRYVLQRIYEELIECHGMCSTGYVTRILNILNGFPEIDVEVVEYYVDAIIQDIRTTFETDAQNDEYLLDSYISFGQERKLFEDYARENESRWKTAIYAKYVKDQHTHTPFLFDEDWKESFSKFLGVATDQV